jgi:hypothetical protein
MLCATIFLLVSAHNRIRFRSPSISIDHHSIDSVIANGKPCVLGDYALNQLADKNGDVRFEWEIYQK